VGQFPPTCGWHTGNGLIRNRTIVALADAVVGFEPRDRGGTWHACLTAVEMKKPLFVVADRRDSACRQSAGRLLRLGAQELSAREAPSAAEFESLVRGWRAPSEPAQAPLFRQPRG